MFKNSHRDRRRGQKGLEETGRVQDGPQRHLRIQRYQGESRMVKVDQGGSCKIKKDPGESPEVSPGRTR